VVRILDFQRVLSMTRRPNFRRRFFSEIGAAIVVLAALCAFAASVAFICAYLHEYGSWYGAPGDSEQCWFVGTCIVPSLSQWLRLGFVASTWNLALTSPSSSYPLRLVN